MAAIHLLFKLVINLKILENCEVINVEFLSRDLPLINSEIMASWKCLKLLNSSKGMYRINIELKKLIRLKYLIVQTPYTFFSIFSWYFIVFTHLTSYRLCFQVLTITTFPFMAFLTFPFCVCFYNFIYFIFKYL